MDMQTAISLVANDQRQSYPLMNDEQAIAHARNTIRIDEITEDDDLAKAYRLVLAPEPKVINQGSNGFHLFTVVSDGYGDLFTEDQYGNVIETASTGASDDPSHYLSCLLDLIQRTNHKLSQR